MGRTSICFMVVCVVLAAVALPASAVTGSLRSDTAPAGLEGVGVWITTGPSFVDWEVYQNPNGSWHYEWTIGVEPTGGISHVLIETSPNFTANDVISANWSDIKVDFWTGNGSNPNLPSTLYGIKFDNVSAGDAMYVKTFSLDTWRTPVWGDVYAKDGVAGNDAPPGGSKLVNQFWNVGIDVYAPNVSIFDVDMSATKIAVPDTASTETVIPEASSILLAIMGLAPTALLRRIRK